MEASKNQNVQDLVLIGGGHSHVDVLKQFGMQPEPKVRLTLIARDTLAPYSGMLPGHLAGIYTHYETHVDLRPLARFSGCPLYHDKVVGLDLDAKQVLCANRPPVPFDLISINVGSRPTHEDVLGVTEYALPAKPVDRFLLGWQNIQERALRSSDLFRLVVVGAGAGGVELALNTLYRLETLFVEHGKKIDGIEVHLATEDDKILATHNPRVRERLTRILKARGVHLHLGYPVNRVEEDCIRSDAGGPAPYDALIWVTHASAPEWPVAAGLETDKNGFIAVDECLRSVSHPFVFAAGDNATMVKSPRPKSGVFAVRQGPYLGQNLRRAVRGEALRAFTPQQNFLSLLGTGNRRAVASRGGWTAEGEWVWRLKNWIDVRWMDKYRNLSAMGGHTGMDAAGPGGPSAVGDTPVMQCGGCGCKVGSTVLSNVLGRLQARQGDDVSIGLHSPDDAAVVELPAGKHAVHTVDFFKSFVDDPYVLGQITVNHCLSDVYAMGAVPHTVLAIATLPFADGPRMETVLYDLLAGALRVLVQEDVSLVGGHTTEGAELTFGLSVNGSIDPGAALRKGGMRPGDRLILTKPIGTGAILAADMRGQAQSDWTDAAIETMLVSNRAAAGQVFEHEAGACTDVTGFGLLGHLVEMVRASSVEAEIRLNALPLIHGALEAEGRGIRSTLYPQNARTASAVENRDEVHAHAVYPLLFDPQTAGGLLASVPEARVEACIDALHAAGYAEACVIGEVLGGEGATATPVRVKA